jgi:biotin synthase-like enzyme
MPTAIAKHNTGHYCTKVAKRCNYCMQSANKKNENKDVNSVIKIN